MTQFKVGDRVRFVLDGDEGIVQNLAILDGRDSALVGWADGLEWVGVEHMELVEEQPNRTYYEPTLTGGYPEETKTENFFESAVHRHLNKIADILISKNKQYANSALDPIRVFSRADRMEQLRVRADDKLSRIRNGDTSEDALTDLAGYIILMKIAEEGQ